MPLLIYSTRFVVAVLHGPWVIGELKLNGAGHISAVDLAGHEVALRFDPEFGFRRHPSCWDNEPPEGHRFVNDTLVVGTERGNLVIVFAAPPALDCWVFLA